MTPLAPPTEAEVKEIRQRVTRWRKQMQGYEDKGPLSLGDILSEPSKDWLDDFITLDELEALCDAYLAQREALEEIALFDNPELDSYALTMIDIARAALSAAPLAPETQNEGDG